MRHWPIRKQQKMSQSQGNNRSKSHVQFPIGVPPSEYLTQITYSQANM